MAYTVLIIDDDRDFRALLKLWLEKRDYLVLEADTGKNAARAMQSRPDLVIVDGLLPDTDGFKWIKARRDAGDQTPMIFMSFFYKDMQSFKKLTGELGVKRVLQKTVGEVEFAAEVEAVLAGAASVAGAGLPSPKPAPGPVLARSSSSVDTKAAVPPAPALAPTPPPAPTPPRAPAGTSEIADLIDDVLATPPPTPRK